VYSSSDGEDEHEVVEDANAPNMDGSLHSQVSRTGLIEMPVVRDPQHEDVYRPKTGGRDKSQRMGKGGHIAGLMGEGSDVPGLVEPSAMDRKLSRRQKAMPGTTVEGPRIEGSFIDRVMSKEDRASLPDGTLVCACV
jgi:hypothetical protein